MTGVEQAAPLSQQRRGGTWQAARLVRQLLHPAARARGFAEIGILEDWPRIVGPGLARRCHPLAVRFERGRCRGGTLVLAAGNAAALELQHAAPQIIERVNQYFGFGAIRTIRFAPVNGHPLPLPAIAPPPAAVSCDPERRAALAAEVEGVVDAGLRAALLGLGLQVAARGGTEVARPGLSGRPPATS